MCVIIYSQFFPRVWGFTVGKRQKVSHVVFGVWWACVASIGAVLLLVWWKGSDGKDGRQSAEGWVWIDVVSCPHLTLKHDAHVKPYHNQHEMGTQPSQVQC